MTEAILLKQCKMVLRILCKQNLLAWRRLHVMPIRYGKDGIRANTDMQGMPDLVILLPNQKTLWVELKTSKGRQSKAQAACQAEWQLYHHSYSIIRSVEDFKALLISNGIKMPWRSHD